MVGLNRSFLDGLGLSALALALFWRILLGVSSVGSPGSSKPYGLAVKKLNRWASSTDLLN